MDVDGGGYLVDNVPQANKPESHLIFGKDPNKVLISQARRQFQPPGQLDSITGKNDARTMTMTHFLLGNDRGDGVTTMNADYQPPGAAFTPAALDVNTKADLRKSHFTLGNENGRMMGREAKGVPFVPGQGSRLNEREERKNKMRKHNFVFGKEDNTFVSTNNASYKPYEGTAGMNNSSKIGDDIGKTHYRLGGQSAPMKTTHQREFIPKSGEPNGGIKDTKTFQRTNFQFGNDRGNMVSSSHMHYKNYPHGESGKLNRQQLNELRKEHFILGKHPNHFRTENQIKYGDNGINMVAPVGNRQMTTTSSVKIGDPKLAGTYFRTTYEQANQERPLGNNIMKKDGISMQGSHFQIGDPN